jgi:hypothetical protein
MEAQNCRTDKEHNERKKKKRYAHTRKIQEIKHTNRRERKREKPDVCFLIYLTMHPQLQICLLRVTFTISNCSIFIIIIPT